MLDFSFAELIVVLIVSLLILNSKDWLKVARYLWNSYKIILKAKKNFLNIIKDFAEELEEAEKNDIKYIMGEDGKMHKSYPKDVK